MSGNFEEKKMSQHKHYQAMDDVAYGHPQGSKELLARCYAQQHGSGYCNLTGAHVYVSCRDGAIETGCKALKKLRGLKK